MDNSELDHIKRLWWLHDSYWHATLIKELGPELASRLNLEANEKFFRAYTLMLLKSKRIAKPRSVEDLMEIFRIIWADCFPDNRYVNEPVTFNGDEATWTGQHCHAYESLSKANMTEGYACGCAAIRDGVMKALRLEPLHSIQKSLIKGNSRCVITFRFKPK